MKYLEPFAFCEGLFLWGPRKFLICGESGGIGRLNDDGVISQCDPIAEHERMLSTNWDKE